MKLYGQSPPPEYDLSRVKVPTAIFYSNADEICTPKVRELKLIESSNSHANYKHEIN